MSIGIHPLLAEGQEHELQRTDNFSNQPFPPQRRATCVVVSALSFAAVIDFRLP